MKDVEIKKIGIVVIQSLPEHEAQTGLELCNEILHYKEYQERDTPYFLWKYTPTTKCEFINCIREIIAKQEEGMLFTLHIESHGGDDGIRLANGETIIWADFMDLIRPINVKMGHLLVLVLAMCLGGAIVSTINSKDRAPYRVCICSCKEVTVDQIRRGFASFYSDYTSPLDIVKGISALQQELSTENNKYGPFRIISARDVFKLTFNLDSNPNAKDHLINTAYIAKRENGEECTKADAEQEIRDFFKSEIETHLPYFDFEDIR